MHWLKKPEIAVLARLSDRVPFGTGPAVQKIVDLPTIESYTYYAPETFIDLRTWLTHIPLLWQALQNHQDPLDALPAHLQQVLQEAGIAVLWTHIHRQVRTPAHCTQVVHHWFDAFQTLKFIRRLQDLRYPARPLAECLQLAPFSQEKALCRTL